MSFMAIEDQNTIGTIWSVDCASVKVLWPLKAGLVIFSVILGRGISQKGREKAFSIPIGEVILACNHDK